MLIAMAGLPGKGKSTLAGRLGEACSRIVLRTGCPLGPALFPIADSVFYQAGLTSALRLCCHGCASYIIALMTLSAM